MTSNERFGSNLARLMEEAGISGNRLADELGLSPAAVSQYKNGRTTPSEINLRKLAEFFDCSTDYLLGRNENPSPDYNIQNACFLTGLTEEAMNNIKKYRNYCEPNLKTGEVKDYKGDLGEIINENLSSPWLRPLLIAIDDYKHKKSVCMARLSSNEIQEGDTLQSVIDMERELSAALSGVIYNFTGMIEDSCGTGRLMARLVKEEAKLRSSPKLEFNAEEFLKGLNGE